MAGAAQGAVIVQSSPFAFPLSPGAEVLAFNQFDPALGTLTKVELFFNGFLGATATAENDSVLDAPDFGLSLTGNASATFGTLSAIGLVNTVFSQALAASDNGGVANGSGPDFHDFGAVGDVFGDTDEENAAFAPYIGLGQINADIDASAGFSFVGTTDATLGINNLGTFGEVFVVYTYDPIPAPGAVALLGLAGVAGLRRRR
jgi:hypothetical protein